MAIAERELIKERPTDGTKMDGAHALMQSLMDHEVDVIFGYPGGAIMPVYDGLYSYKNRIRHILSRNEQGAGHMAEGYARVTGKPGIVFATSGPGATNITTPMYDAFMDNTPVIAVTGQVNSSMIGKRAFQEAPVMKIFEEITKWRHQVRNSQEVIEVFDEAYYQALSGRPGPVLIDFPKDFQFGEVDYRYLNSIDRLSKPSLNFETRERLDELARRINVADKPYILAGQGIHLSRAYLPLRNVSERNGIPVATTLLGLSSFPGDHPNNMGMPGMHGQLGANNMINHADLLIGIGMRCDDRVVGNKERFAPDAFRSHIDIDPELNKLVAMHLTVQADATLALEYLLPKLAPRNRERWISEFRAKDEIQKQAVTTNALSPTGPIKTAEVAHMLSNKTQGKATIVADVGQHQMLAAQYYISTEYNNVLTTGGAGTMGYSIPAALGVKVANPERQVIAFVGDGSFQQTEQELTTIAQEKAAVKVIVLDNGLLGMVDQWQGEFHGGRKSEVELYNPDFVLVGKARGIDGVKVEDRKDLSNAMDELLDSQKPRILHIKIDPNEKVLPMMPPGAGVDQIKLS